MISSVEYSSLGAAAYRSDLWPVALYGPRTAFSRCRSDSRGVYTPQRVWIEDETGKIVGEWTDSVHPLHSQTPTDPWDTLDELAFAGEAMFEYLTLPYLLAEPTRSSMRR